MLSWLIAPACHAATTACSCRLSIPFMLKSVFNSSSAWPSVTNSGTSSVEFHQ